MRHGGQIIVHQLKKRACERVFTVPGVQVTHILDGLYENAKIQTVTCRQENAASLMAQAHGQLKDTPGVCLVSGPTGALNASIGLHTARTNGTPMLLFVGLPETSHMYRGGTIEIDIATHFSGLAKYVAVVDDASRIPEYVNRAWQVSLSGRPGPVVIAVPQNVQRQRAHTEDLVPQRRTVIAPSENDLSEMLTMITSSSRPVMIVGGAGWNSEVTSNLETFAENFDLPIVADACCQDYLDNHNKHYTGHLSTHADQKLIQHIKDSDLLIVLGTELEENSERLQLATRPDRQIIHIHPDPHEPGRLYQADLAINSDTLHFSRKLAQLTAPKAIPWCEWRHKARKDFENYLLPLDTPGDVKLEYIVRVINEVAPKDTILTFGGGAYASWLHRYYQFRKYLSQLSPKCGLAEYALPSAISAKLASPGRTVIAVTGDGGFLMNAGELATAMHFGLKIIIVVVNNNMFGAARLAQETSYPGRVLGTRLSNPDIIKYAESFGATGETVEHRKAFRTVLKRALQAETSTVINLPIDENAISTDRSLLDFWTEY